MCRINFEIQYQEPDTNVIMDWEGQYRIEGSNVWIPFEFDWNNPQTPNLIELGAYQMRIRIFDGRVWSDWFLSYFSIGCGGFTIGYSIGFNS